MFLKRAAKTVCQKQSKFSMLLILRDLQTGFIAPAGISPRRRNPRRHSSQLTRILRKVLTVEIYSHTVNIEKISICLNRGCEESVGNDDVSIVCARKYEMVRMT